MKRRELLLWLAASGCRSRARLDFGHALVDAAVHSGVQEELDNRCLDELSRLVSVARQAIDAEAALAPSRTLATLLFEQWGFVREVSDDSLANVLLPTVVERRRGNCVGLGSLYLALADELRIPAVGVLMPGHFYVRAGGTGKWQNIELLRSGEVMPDQWYQERFPIPGGSARSYARPLTNDEVLGVIAYDVGNERRRQLRIDDARVAYTRAVQAFPDLGEAHASLGAVEQMLGNRQAATACYRTAREVNPHLPGIDENLAMLEAEQAGRQ